MGSYIRMKRIMSANVDNVVYDCNWIPVDLSRVSTPPFNELYNETTLGFSLLSGLILRSVTFGIEEGSVDMSNTVLFFFSVHETSITLLSWNPYIADPGCLALLGRNSMGISFLLARSVPIATNPNVRSWIRRMKLVKK